MSIERQKQHIKQIFEGVHVDERPTTIRFNEESEPDRIDATLHVHEHARVPISFAVQSEVDAETAAKGLFKLLSGGSPTSDEFARDYDEMSPAATAEEFQSDHMNSTILEYLTEFCQYFGIDDQKMSAFIASIADCDYCGTHTSPVREIDGEHVCEECLRKEK